jgi:hypothetical protein
MKIVFQEGRNFTPILAAFKGNPQDEAIYKMRLEKDMLVWGYKMVSINTGSL